jgi:hypothetical protein
MLEALCDMFRPSRSRSIQYGTPLAQSISLTTGCWLGCVLQMYKYFQSRPFVSTVISTAFDTTGAAVSYSAGGGNARTLRIAASSGNDAPPGGSVSTFKLVNIQSLSFATSATADVPYVNAAMKTKEANFIPPNSLNVHALEAMEKLT